MLTPEADSFPNSDSGPPEYSNVIKEPNNKQTGIHIYSSLLAVEFSRIYFLNHDQILILCFKEENPPSYESILVKLKRAGEESANPVEYARSAFKIICESCKLFIIFTICLRKEEYN
jgi:hypothetical protein